jgi:transposase
MEEVPMGIVGGLDLHRRQITFDWLDVDSGEQQRGVIRPATRLSLREWLEQFRGTDAAFAVEATTGWRFVVEELRRAGCEVHVAEPAETRALRGRKRRAKTDRADARHLRDLLINGTLPESWIPTDFIADLRTKVRLRKVLVSQRSGWAKRIYAQCYHHGLPIPPDPLTIKGAQWVAAADLPATAHQVVMVALQMIDILDDEVDKVDKELRTIARHQKGCVALQTQWGVGPVISAAVVAELGDVTRLSSSRKAVRFAGLDVTIHESDGKRTRGHLSRQGPSVLRWAVYEAANNAWRVASPDHDYYLAAKERIGAKRARLSVSRRVLRRSYHILANLGEVAIEPV